MPGRYPAKVKLIGRVFAFMRHFFSSIVTGLVLILVGSKPHTVLLIVKSDPISPNSDPNQTSVLEKIRPKLDQN